jgi:deoxycytidylate deaminase
MVSGSTVSQEQIKRAVDLGVGAASVKDVRLIAAVCSGRPGTLEKLHDLQHIFCDKTSYGARTVTGDGDALFRTQKKIRSMKVLLLLVVMRPGNSGYFLCDQAITDRKGNPQFINRFSCFLNWVG